MSVLDKINKIVFTPGHGGPDSGAVRGDGLKEADTTRIICDSISELSNQYETNGLEIVIEDKLNQLNLTGVVGFFNKKYKQFNKSINNNTLVVEIHQDGNYPQAELERQNKQMGTYYYQGDRESKELAYALRQKFVEYGAYNATPEQYEDFNGTWAKGHYLPWRGFHLGFIQNTKALSLIIECGYISGSNRQEDLDRFAMWIFRAFVELKGRKPATRRGKKEMEKTNMIIPEIQRAISSLQNINEEEKANLIYSLREGSNDPTYIARVLADKQRDINLFYESKIKLEEELKALKENSNQIVTYNPSQASQVAKEPLLDDNYTSTPRIKHVQMNTPNIDGFVNRIKEISDNRQLQDSTNNFVAEAGKAIKQKSWKRFTITLLYFLLTAGSLIFSVLYPEQKWITEIVNQTVKNDTMGALLALVTGGYITAQTITDIKKMK